MIDLRVSLLTLYAYLLYLLRMRILMTEGAGLTSRQVATRLDALGHEVWAAVPDRWCMARFTRHVHHLMEVPAFGPDPLGWFECILEQAVAASIDVIFPTQEQVTVLSHQLPRLTAAGIATAVPSFRSLTRVQDKLAALRTLRQLDIPQPHTEVVTDIDLMNWHSFPAFVKTPVGTGSTGVVRVETTTELESAVARFMAGAGRDGGVLVQEAVVGTFAMAQCIFDAGHLVGFHVNQRVREGANGSASAKQSVTLPSLQADLTRLGLALGWHGALSVDAIWDGTRASVIDVNPRLVEPGNALGAGTDMVSILLAVATDSYVPVAVASATGWRTHQLLMAILGAAQRGRRRDVAREIVGALSHRGVYRNSCEELQPVRGDWRAVILPVAASLATLVRPRACEFFTDGAVQRYSLAPDGWRALCREPPLGQLSATPA
jgi:glutathione synthase/RimK-type ligase-like ATP-grasp enzyme